jgi:hypothetical protein
MSKIVFFIEPHVRSEAISAFRHWLDHDQIAEIENAEESAIIQLRIDATGTQVVIIPEG